MRRCLLVLVILLGVAGVVLASGQAATVPATSDSQQLRAAAGKLLATGSADDAAKAADLLDKASQIDARNAATLKAQTDSGLWPFLVSITPFLSVMGVALSFLYNSYQTREEAARQRVEDEGKRFLDVVTLIQKTEHFSPTVVLLSQFAAGPYAERARQAGATALLGTKDYDNFVVMFNSFVEPITVESLDQVLHLLRSVHITFGPLLTRKTSPLPADQLSAEEEERYELLLEERRFLGSKVGTLLRLKGDRPAALDLRNLGFDGTDLTGADLRNADITTANWNLVNLDGADLRGITTFDNGWLFNTAWWHAAYIDKPFLDYLKEHCGFVEGQGSHTLQAISEEEYQANVKRLEDQAQPVSASRV